MSTEQLPRAAGCARLGPGVPMVLARRALAAGRRTRPEQRPARPVESTPARRALTPAAPGERRIPPGALEAARWLRAHSRPDDLVATDVHCRRVLAGAPLGRTCDARHLWLAAFAQRRVVLEGWAYTARATNEAARGGGFATPFWDPALLAANDAAFARPSPATVGLLRDRHGVRWLFADARHGPAAPALARVARLRFRAGACAVFELPPR